MSFPELDKNFDHQSVEGSIQQLWEESKIHDYDVDAEGEVFSVDTPPPYVSAAHLHVGHAMSYAQAEFVVRYHRMNGKKIFYPMGFDDNGLPTERFVEQKHKINKSKTTRSEFRNLCVEETTAGAKTYEQLWRALGLSVDWKLRYSSIDEHCRKTAQKSFIDLYNKGVIYRSDEPVLWDTHFETALAQADLETLDRKAKLNDIAFTGPDGEELVISTTRPELIAACVAVYHHPDDERYKHLAGKMITVPIFGQQVPVKTSDQVDPEFGTGLMQVSTFGDSEDVRKWKEDKLDTRVCISPNGRMTELAAPYDGKPVEEARALITKDLKAQGFLKNQEVKDQKVSVAERSGTPVEFMMVPQWFIRVLDLKDDILKRGEEVNWYPEFMNVRLKDWVEGLKYDWNISRQRFYGVPFPVWYDKDGNAVIADESQLPIDPTEDKYTGSDHNPDDLSPELDVMDTWMTSSLTPLVNANWAESPGRKGSMGIYPMTLRVQAFEIIRTWLFYTLIKSHLHTDTLPWENVMISGWGLNEQGKKISKRDLENFTDDKGYNRYEPYAVIEKYGADALRYWATGSQLGSDLRYNEKDVKAGRKLVVKMWNAARFVLMQLEGFDPKSTSMPVSERTAEDRWLLNELNDTIRVVTKAFETYDYGRARERLEKFFWMTFCDNYLEITKDRFWNPDRYDESARISAQWTLWESLRTVLGLFAPFIPFVTEELYQQVYKPYEDAVSLHVSDWPKANPEWENTVQEMDVVLSILRTVRSLRTQSQISQGQQLKALIIDLGSADESLTDTVKQMQNSLQAVARAEEVRYDTAANDCESLSLKVGIEAAEQKKAG